MPPIQRLIANDEACRGCEACTLACAVAHEGAAQPGLARLVVTKDMARYEFHIDYCRHCEDPPCLAACPTAAMSLDARGVVLIEDELCIRCGACAEACPYNAVYYLAEQDRYIKCDLCAGRPEGPLCVAFCPVEAMLLTAEEVTT